MAGLALVAASFAVGDPGLAAVAFWGGLAVGNGGMLLTGLLTGLVLWREGGA